MDKKQVFDKVFMNEEQLVKKMLEEAEAKKIAKKIAKEGKNHNFLHSLGIHYYRTKSRSDHYKVGKCKDCGRYQTTEEDAFPKPFFAILSGITCLIIGLALLIVFIIPPNYPLEQLIAGIILLIPPYFLLKYGITDFVWD